MDCVPKLLRPKDSVSRTVHELLSGFSDQEREGPEKKKTFPLSWRTRLLSSWTALWAARCFGGRRGQLGNNVFGARLAQLLAGDPSCERQYENRLQETG